MAHKFYHSRTGQVWSVTKRVIGVEMNKQVLQVMKMSQCWIIAQISLPDFGGCISQILTEVPTESCWRVCWPYGGFVWFWVHHDPEYQEDCLVKTKSYSTLLHVVWWQSGKAFC